MIQVACVDRATLLALEDGVLPDPEAGVVRSHLLSCSRCRALAAELDELGEAVSRFAGTRAAGACPEDLVLASYAEGRLSGGERMECEAHLSACGRCAADLAALGRELAGLEADPGVVTPSWALERTRALVLAAPWSAVSPRRWSRVWASLRAQAWPAAAIASVALIVLVQLPRSGDVGPAMRGPRPAPAAGIVLTAPIGGTSLTTARGVLSWQPIAGAGTYKVTVVDASGGIVWSVETSSPEIALSPGLRLEPGATYSWWVEMLTDAGESIESPIAHFTVSP